MPNIRSKTLQSGRVGSALNGLAQFDQTDWSGDYGQTSGDEWTGDAVYADAGSQGQPATGFEAPPNLLSDVFNFGAKLLNVQTATPAPSTPQVRYATQRPQSGMNMPLLIAGALAAVFILSRK